MPHRLKKRQKKIQEKRKKTPWRQFLMEMASWLSFTFYKNDGIISRYPSTSRIKTQNYKEFMIQRDDLTKYEYTLQSDRSFFQNMQAFFSQFHHPNLIFYGTVENVAFSDQSYDSKNVYLSNTTIVDCENVLYSFSTSRSSNIINSFYVKKGSEVVYYSRGVQSSYKIFYSAYINNSNNIRFSHNLTGCSECIFCSHLENQKYCIRNKQLNKEEYMKQKEKILSEKNKFESYYDELAVMGENHGSVNVSGNYILNSENVENGRYVMYGKNQRNVGLTGGKTTNEDFYDVFSAGAAGGNDFCAVLAAGKSDNLYNSTLVAGSSNIYYSYYLENCSYCLGCIGLKNKSFCIFNKQYTKEEWFDKVDEIFSKMEQDGDLGKFFPGSMNPFYFNDTAAYLIDPSFTKEEVEAQGYLWRDEPIKVDIPDGVQTVKTSELNQFESFDDKGKGNISDEILRKVIVDEAGNAYRVIPMELAFLRKYGLPLPRKHRLERLKGHFKVK